MGLDIYIRKTREQAPEKDFYTTSTKEQKDYWRKYVIDAEEKRSDAFLAADYARCVMRLTEVSGRENYDRVHEECLRCIEKHFSYPEFSIGYLGYEKNLVRFDNPEEHGGRRSEYVVTYNSVPVETWLDKAREIIEHHYAPSVAYFRKVNLLFAYFENSGKIIDESFALMTKEDCLDIIDRCQKVLENHDLAKELLPTQGGFFFGSTDYDEWYFSDVENVLKQFSEKVLPVFDTPCWGPGEVSAEYVDEKYNCYVYFSW